MNEAAWTKSTSEEEIFTQLCQDHRHMKEEMVKLTNIQNEKLDKLTNITQNHENKQNGIQKMMVEHENKLNQLGEEKVQLHNEMVQKTNPIVLQLDRQEQYIRKENILIYGVQEDKDDNDDGEKNLVQNSRSA